MSARVFYIELFNNQVTVEEKLNGKYKILRREGENSFKFESDFWEWFKNKIEYENEPLEFEILSDIEINFDSSLNIIDVKYLEDKLQEKYYGQDEKKEEEEIKNSNPLYEFMKRKIESYRRDR